MSAELIQFMTIQMLAVMSPGPDFAIVSRNALNSGKELVLLPAWESLQLFLFMFFIPHLVFHKLSSITLVFFSLLRSVDLSI